MQGRQVPGSFSGPFARFAAAEGTRADCVPRAYFLVSESWTDWVVRIASRLTAGAVRTMLQSPDQRVRANGLHQAAIGPYPQVHDDVWRLFESDEAESWACALALASFATPEAVRALEQYLEASIPRLDLRARCGEALAALMWIDRALGSDHHARFLTPWSILEPLAPRPSLPHLSATFDHHMELVVARRRLVRPARAAALVGRLAGLEIDDQAPTDPADSVPYFNGRSWVRVGRHDSELPSYEPPPADLVEVNDRRRLMDAFEALRALGYSAVMNGDVELGDQARCVFYEADAHDGAWDANGNLIGLEVRWSGDASQIADVLASHGLEVELSSRVAGSIFLRGRPARTELPFSHHRFADVCPILVARFALAMNANDVEGLWSNTAALAHAFRVWLGEHSPGIFALMEQERAASPHVSPYHHRVSEVGDALRRSLT